MHDNEALSARDSDQFVFEKVKSLTLCFNFLGICRANFCDKPVQFISDNAIKLPSDELFISH